MEGWIINGISYNEYMASAEWRALRRVRLEIDGYECRGCGRGVEEVSFHIHHKRYNEDFGGNEDVESDLTTFCVACHDAITSVIRRIKYSKRLIKVDALDQGTAGTKGQGNVKRENVSVDIISGINHAQRPAGKSIKQVVAFDQGDYI